MIILYNLQLAKREYRGQRSPEAITDYVKDQLRDPVQQLQQYQDLQMGVSGPLF